MQPSLHITPRLPSLLPSLQAAHPIPVPNPSSLIGCRFVSPCSSGCVVNQRVSTIVRLQMSKGEIRDIAAAFEEPCLWYGKGIKLCGETYMVPIAERPAPSPCPMGCVRHDSAVLEGHR